MERYMVSRRRPAGAAGAGVGVGVCIGGGGCAQPLVDELVSVTMLVTK